MDFIDFQKLPFETKCDIITMKSTFLTVRKHEEFNIFLYYAGKFFIEVFYSSKQAKVIMLNGFELMDNKKLEGYLDKISLPQL